MSYDNNALHRTAFPARFLLDGQGSGLLQCQVVRNGPIKELFLIKGYKLDWENLTTTKVHPADTPKPEKQADIRDITDG